jgi:TctA family transporter
MNIDVALSTLFQLLTTPYLILLMLIAVPLGAFFGAVPGLGGKLGIVLLIPFVFGMEPVAGMVLLLAMHAVTGTAGQIPSILFGVPGEGTATATVMDGYPMHKNGEGGRLGRALAHPGSVGSSVRFSSASCFL